MGKSLYEQYAEQVQTAALKSTKTLSDAIETLKKLKETVSEEYLNWAEEVISLLYGFEHYEIRDAVNGKEAWISISGCLPFESEEE